MLKTGVHGARASRLLGLGLDVPLTPDVAVAVATQSDAGFSVGVRREHFVPSGHGLPGEVGVGEVGVGEESFIHLRTIHQGVEQLLVVREDGQSDVERGDHMTVSINGPVHVFGSDGEYLGD